MITGLLEASVTNPAVQTSIAAVVINFGGALVSLHLWKQDRSERMLLLWALAWCANGLRWSLHPAAESSPPLRAVELGLALGFIVLAVTGAYEASPTKPWRTGTVAAAWLVIGATGFGLGAFLGAPVQFAYAVAVLFAAFAATCLLLGFRATRLTGYALAAAMFILQAVFFVVALALLGPRMFNSILHPLFVGAVIASTLVLCHQRNRFRLIESQRQLRSYSDALAESARRYRSFVNQPVFGVTETRFQDGKFIEVNERFAEMLGYERAELAALDIAAITHPDDLGADMATLQEVLRSKPTGFSMEKRYVRKDGSIMWAILNVTPLVPADHPEPSTMLSVVLDISRRQEAEERLQTYARQMRDLAMRLGSAEESERKALHRELHDRVGGGLSALGLDLDLLIESAPNPQMREGLLVARRIVSETMAAARNLMAELRPPSLDEFGLAAALRSLAEQHAALRSYSVEVLGHDLDPRPGEEVERELFRIAQEALSNAARHAGPSRVRIEIERDEDGLSVIIEDDGVGFDPAAPAPRGWGLKTMRERAIAIGGELYVDSRPGGGTRITAQVPEKTALPA